jgi:hypothetical protein
LNATFTESGIQGAVYAGARRHPPGRRRPRGGVYRTPVVTSSSLEQEFGAPIALKAELFQKTGSFKVHGLLMKTLG